MSQSFQFQIGLSHIEFTTKFGSESKCQRHFESHKWPEGFTCRQCSCKEYSSVSKRGSQLIYHCKNCRKQESLRSGTLLEGNRQPLLKWYWIFHLMSQSKNCISALELHRLVDIPYSSTLRIKHKIMQMMFENDKELIGDYVEINETYLEKSPVEQGKQQTASESYRPFIIALQTSSEGRPIRIKLSPVANFKRQNMQSWLEGNVCDCCETVCDTQHCYENMCAICKNKTHMIVLPKEENKSGPNWMNIILSNIKASIYGTFHSINYKSYANLYLADIQYRFNRRFNLKEMFYGLISCAVRPPVKQSALLE